MAKSTIVLVAFALLGVLLVSVRAQNDGGPDSPSDAPDSFDDTGPGGGMGEDIDNEDDFAKNMDTDDVDDSADAAELAAAQQKREDAEENQKYAANMQANQAQSGPPSDADYSAQQNGLPYGAPSPNMDPNGQQQYAGPNGQQYQGMPNMYGMPNGNGAYGMHAPSMIKTQQIDKHDHITHAQGYAAAFHDVHDLDSTGRPAISDHHTCKNLNVYHTYGPLHQEQCKQVCSSQGADFWAPNTLEQARCLDRAVNKTALWINLQQTFTTERTTQLFNAYTQDTTHNFAPVIRRNNHDGLIFSHHTRATGEKNCVYYDPTSLKNYATDCGANGDKVSGCACKRAKHQSIPCSQIHVLDATSRRLSGRVYRQGVRMNQCDEVCLSERMTFFAPSDSSERTCLQRARPNRNMRTWINMLQFFPIPGSEALAFRENMMNLEIADIPDKAHFGLHPRKLPVNIGPKGHHAGLSQNCLYVALGQAGVMKTVGVNCRERLNYCACTTAHINKKK